MHASIDACLAKHCYHNTVKEDRLQYIKTKLFHKNAKLHCCFNDVTRVYTFFFTSIWPLLTQNNLLPPSKAIGFLYSMWYIHIPNMRSVQASLLEISCSQAGYHKCTYTHTLAIMDAKVTIIIAKKEKKVYHPLA